MARSFRCAAAALVYLALAQPSLAVQWVKQDVYVSPYEYSIGTSLALGAGLRPHIAYTSGVDGSVNYATQTAAGWQTQTVAPSGGSYISTSLAIDALDHPAIIYGLSTSGVNYAHSDGSTWSTESLSTGNGGLTDLAFDSAGNAHVAYTDNFDVRYAKRIGGSFNTTTVGTSYFPHRPLELALNPQGYPRFAYWEQSPSAQLKYAAWNGTSWNVSTVTTLTSQADGKVSLALDSSGTPHLLFHQDVFLKYATLSGSGWNIQTVPALGHTGTGMEYAIAIRPDDKPAIVFNEGVTKATFAILESGVWQTELLAQNSKSVGYFSLTLDLLSRPHVSYWQGDRVIYAVGVPEPAMLTILVCALWTAMHRTRR